MNVGISSIPMVDVNPWTPEGFHEIANETGGEEFRVFDKDGKSFTLKAAIRINGKITKDRLPYRKLYFDQIQKIMALSPSGFKLFCYVLSRIERNRDEIVIDPILAVMYCKYKSRTQFYKGLREMVDNDFVIRKADTRMSYFFNVNVFFNGDRVKMVADRHDI